MTGIALALHVSRRYEIPCQGCGHIFTASDAVPEVAFERYAEWRDEVHGPKFQPGVDGSPAGL